MGLKKKHQKSTKKGDSFAKSAIISRECEGLNPQKIST